MLCCTTRHKTIVVCLCLLVSACVCLCLLVWLQKFRYYSQIAQLLRQCFFFFRRNGGVRVSCGHETKNTKTFALDQNTQRTVTHKTSVSQQARELSSVNSLHGKLVC